MRPKHILVPLIMSLAIFSFNPNLASAEVELLEKELQNEHVEASGGNLQNENIEIEEEETETEKNLINKKNNQNILLQKGDSNPEVKKLKKNLALIGFVVSSNPNNNFGPSTERKVREFQEYYGLTVSGVVDYQTQNKINEILDSPYHNGRSHESVIQLKKDHERLGFKVANNPNTRYGPTTERKVREFQSFYNLIDNGIADEVTLAKIQELLNTPMKRGDYRKDVIFLKEQLAKLGFVVSNNPNPSFGPATERVVKEFQAYYGLTQSGIADSRLLEKIDSLLDNALKRGSKNSSVLKMKEDLAIIGFKVSNNPNTTFGPSTEKVVKEFQSYYGLRETGIFEEKTESKVNEILDSPYRNGRSHESVIQLKRDLERLGFKVSNNPNTRYGPTTEKKVQEFQEYFGLIVNGIGDPVTISKINDILTNSLDR